MLQADIGAPAEAISAPDLSSLPGFGQLDIQSNEGGRLSAEQHSRLRRRLRNEALGGLAVSVFLAGWGAAGASAGNFIYVAFAAVFVVGIAWGLVRLATSIRRDSVLAVEGDAHLEFEPGDESPDRYWVHVGGLKLGTEKQVYRGMPNGGPYRVFYLVGLNWVVAARAQAGWAPLPAAAPKKRPWWRNVSVEVG